MTCLEWSCDVRQDFVRWFFPLPIYIRDCEGLFVCPTIHIWCGHNECSSQRGCIWGHRTWVHKELYSVVWVAPILVLVGCGLQDPHATYQCYEEFTIVENPTVWNFGRIFKGWASGIFKSGWCSVITGGYPDTWILVVIIHLSHAFMDFSYWPHISYA